MQNISNKLPIFERSMDHITENVLKTIVFSARARCRAAFAATRSRNPRQVLSMRCRHRWFGPLWVQFQSFLLNALPERASSPSQIHSLMSRVWRLQRLIQEHVVTAAVDDVTVVFKTLRQSVVGGFLFLNNNNNYFRI